MELTPLRIASNNLNVKGTGRYKGIEQYPCTLTLMSKLKISDAIINQITAQQHTSLDKLMDEVSKDLRVYQVEDVMFLSNRKNAGCFNEQRTGKTPTILRTLKQLNIKKFLIISPASMLYKWQEECERWLQLPCVVADGTASKRNKTILTWETGGLVISYECVRGTGNDLINIHGQLETIEACILDEAHRIKNHKSKQAEAVFSLSAIPIKYALTGTPAQNKQYEIYSILHWLFPKLFSGYWRFIDYYFTQELKYGAGNQFTEIGNFKPGKEKELQQFLEAISVRRLRASVMAWLPEKDYELIKLECTDKQTAYLKELRESFEITDTDVMAVNILDRLIKERQLCLSPELLGLKGTSPKIDWIKSYLKDYPDQSIIIFSNFTKWLKLLSKELACSNLIIGETSKLERTRLIKEFQCGKIKLLLLNIKAAKEGITLDVASTAIFTDKYTPVADILQAEDRFVATTKDKKDTGHTIIELVMKNTYEENILKLLKNNAEAIDVINNYINYLKGDEPHE